MARRSSTEDLTPALAATLKHLSKPRTAATLAKRLGVSRPTAYARVRALIDSKHAVESKERIREGTKGPLAAQYVAR